MKSIFPWGIVGVAVFWAIPVDPRTLVETVTFSAIALIISAFGLLIAGGIIDETWTDARGAGITFTTIIYGLLWSVSTAMLNHVALTIGFSSGVVTKLGSAVMSVLLGLALLDMVLRICEKNDMIS